MSVGRISSQQSDASRPIKDDSTSPTRPLFDTAPSVETPPSWAQPAVGAPPGACQVCYLPGEKWTGAPAVSSKHVGSAVHVAAPNVPIAV